MLNFDKEFESLSGSSGRTIGKEFVPWFSWEYQGKKPKA